MNMTDIDRIPEITDHVLAGLKADDELKHRIFVCAANRTQNNRAFSFKAAAALVCVSLLLIISCALLTLVPSGKGSGTDLHVIPAGSHKLLSPVDMQQVIDYASGTHSIQDGSDIVD